jgi:hypothetical protein
MRGDWDIEVVLIAPAGTGPVMLAGAMELVSEAAVDLDLACDHYRLEREEGAVGVTAIGAGLDGRSVDDLTTLALGAVDGLLAAHPELTGWGRRVTATPSEPDDDETEDLDARAARLLPDGDEIARALLHAIAYERSVYDSAERFTAWGLEDLTAWDLDDLSPPERAAALRRARALAGCLILASVITVDELFQDVDGLRQERDGDPAAIAGTWILSGLPARFADRYSALFAQKFLVALADVTVRFTGEWKPLACVAQELALRVILNQVEVIAETADVALDDGWRGHLEDLLFDDLDHELLYDMAFDGIEDDVSRQPPGMAPMRFEDWFAPFNPECALPPYALPSR